MGKSRSLAKQRKAETTDAHVHTLAVLEDNRLFLQFYERHLQAGKDTIRAMSLARIDLQNYRASKPFPWLKGC